MPEKERKPRARKKASVSDAGAVAPEHTSPADIAAVQTTASEQPADLPTERDQDSPPRPSGTRATIDHMHDSFHQPRTHGEVF